MVFYFIAAIYLLIYVYIARRVLFWLKAISGVFNKIWVKIIFYFFFITILAGLPLLSFFVPSTEKTLFLKTISNYWFGGFLYTVLVILFIDLLRLIGKLTKITKKEIFQTRKAKVITGLLGLVTILSVCFYGVYHARVVNVKHYDFQISKTIGSISGITIALVSDLHLGHNIGVSQLEEIVEKVNDMDADIVCLAGDIFDNDYEAVKDPDRVIQLFKNFKSKYGVYACFGNHDVDYDILGGFQVSERKTQIDDNRMSELLEKAEVTLLRDETVLVNNEFYVTGRLDYRPIGILNPSRKTAELLLSDLNKTRPIIVLDHQPSDLEALRQNGADVVLSGHTHDGQLFPGNLIVRMINKNGYGYLKDGNMHSVVTSGAGLWGPYMRVGTDCEVVSIRVGFAQ